MKIFHCAANSGLLSCLPMVYPACCPCSSSLSAENCGGGLLPLGSNITADGYIPTAVAAAVVQSVRPISNIHAGNCPTERGNRSIHAGSYPTERRNRSIHAGSCPTERESHSIHAGS